MPYEPPVSLIFINFIQRRKIKTMEEGKALWNLMENKEVYEKGKLIKTGSFRWNARLIADVCGGSYMDYYCSEADEKVLKQVKKKLKGVSFKEYDIEEDQLHSFERLINS